MEGKMPTIIDVNAEAAKLTMFRGLTPQTKRAERKGSAAHLPPYRDGLLLLGKSAGTSHWETHPEDELVHILDGAATLDVDDPRANSPDLDLGDATRSPSIVDLNTELAKLTMFRGRTPQSTVDDRKGSSAQLASY